MFTLWRKFRGVCSCVQVICSFSMLSSSYAERPASGGGQQRSFHASKVDGSAHINLHGERPLMEGAHAEVDVLAANGNDPELSAQLIQARRAKGPWVELRPLHDGSRTEDSARKLAVSRDKVATSFAQFAETAALLRKSGGAGGVSLGISLVGSVATLEQKRLSTVQVLADHSVQASMHLILALAGINRTEGAVGSLADGALSDEESQSARRLTQFVAANSHAYFSEALSNNMQALEDAHIREQEEENNLHKSLVNLTQRLSGETRVCCLKYITWPRLQRYQTLSGTHCEERGSIEKRTYNTCCRDADIRGLGVKTGLEYLVGSNYMYVCCQDVQGRDEPCA